MYFFCLFWSMNWLTILYSWRRECSIFLSCLNLGFFLNPQCKSSIKDSNFLNHYQLNQPIYLNGMGLYLFGKCSFNFSYLYFRESTSWVSRSCRESSQLMQFKRMYKTMYTRPYLAPNMIIYIIYRNFNYLLIYKV